MELFKISFILYSSLSDEFIQTVSLNWLLALRKSLITS